MIDFRSTIRLPPKAKSSVDPGSQIYIHIYKSKHFACWAQFHSGINVNLHKHDQLHGLHCDNANYSQRVRDLLICTILGLFAFGCSLENYPWNWLMAFPPSIVSLKTKMHSSRMRTACITLPQTSFASSNNYHTSLNNGSLLIFGKWMCQMF